MTRRIRQFISRQDEKGSVAFVAHRNRGEREPRTIVSKINTQRKTTYTLFVFLFFVIFVIPRRHTCRLNCLWKVTPTSSSSPHQSWTRTRCRVAKKYFSLPRPSSFTPLRKKDDLFFFFYQIIYTVRANFYREISTPTFYVSYSISNNLLLSLKRSRKVFFFSSGNFSKQLIPFCGNVVSNFDRERRQLGWNNPMLEHLPETFFVNYSN